ncbi:MAG: (2Fe-2S)-binding protein [Thermoplasmata archaeon]|nr:(2Fe-2S)-binding protein [Thermoplasmata archaeon]RLF68247.1 MAG: (2Fe-2S)-binding protein [Thermoplasmata archaeon]
MSEEPVIICRCNDVTEEEIVALIEEGITDIEVIKRLTRIGMGPCQGRTCIPLVQSIIARRTGKPMEEIPSPTSRHPVKPVRMGVFAGEEVEE